MPHSPLFSKGDTVRIRADTSLRGVVTDGPRSQNNHWEYAVFVSDQVRWFAESQLVQWDQKLQPNWTLNHDDLLIRLLQSKLEHPLTDALYSYRASRTEFEAYQFRPALKFLGNGGRGILIADEVGLGKTIEAAIIYLELKARTDANRVLVLCPSRLCQKWHDELLNRFEEDFEVLSRNRVREIFDQFRRGLMRDMRAIASFETMRSPEIYGTWTELGIPLDLLIVDEAHHLRNEGTKQHHLGVALSQASDANVFLSATPLHLKERDLFNLLSLLAPDEFDNHQLFAEQLEPNQYINAAMKLASASRFDEAFKTLKKVETTALRDRYLQNPYYEDALRKLQQARGDRRSTRAAVLEIQQNLGELNTLSGILSRTRKREMTAAPLRSASTINVPLNPRERALYNAVLNRVQTTVRANPGGAPGFGAIMEERQAASCLPAVAAKLKALRSRGTMDLEVDESPFELAEADRSAHVRPSHGVLEAANALDESDSKFELLMEILERVADEGPESKVLLFSFFRGTLAYLAEQLRRRGFRPLVIHGEIKMPDRYRIIDEFKNSPEHQILLSSEVGAEGLDFQFCNVLVNYDLPWNPMQVEQRIGRLDRFGQKHDKIRIWNFYIDDTIETRIFQRLYDRIDLFQRSIGDLEAILGQVIKELTQTVLTRELAPHEQVRLAEEAANRVLRRQAAEEELDRHKDALLGQGAILDQRIMNALESGRFISGNEVRAMVFRYLQEAFPSSRVIQAGHEPCAVIEMDPTFLVQLSRTIEKENLRARVSPALSRALSGARRLRVTFDSDMARQSQELDFVTISHPLAIAALNYWKDCHPQGLPCGRIAIAGPGEEAGLGAYYLYEIDIRAVNGDVTLEPVVILDDGRVAVGTARSILGELQQPQNLGVLPEPDSDAVLSLLEEADAIVARKRAQLEENARRRNDAALIARKAALRSSFGAKIRRAVRLRDSDTDERIRRMYASQAIKLETILDAKLKELENLREVSVSSRLVMGGRVKVVDAAGLTRS